MKQKKINARVPKLRFPKFKNAGEWEEKKLGEVAEFFKGKGISKEDIDQNGKILCIRYGELYTYYDVLIDSIRSRTNVPNTELFISKINDVIIPSSGETKEDIAKASCILIDWVALGGDINVIRSNKLNGIFFSYYINSAKKRDISKIAQGDTVVHLYISQLEKLLVSFPSLPEQQKIADCLSSLDELISAHSKKLDTLKTYKKGLMQNLFPADGETVPKLRFREFKKAGEWEEKKLGKVLTIQGGFAFDSNNFLDYGNYQIIKMSNVYNGILDLTRSASFINILKDNEREFLLNDKDIILSLTGTVGKRDFGHTVILQNPNNLLLNQRLARLYKPINVEAKFVFYTSKTIIFQDQFFMLAKGGTGNQTNVGTSDISQIKIRIPSLPEQQKIADCLSSLDELISSQAQKIETLKVHKKGLMQGLFPAGEKE